jgi:hypothetical protein
MVLTLYCGESEFEECKRSIRSQYYSNVEHVVIKDKPNKEAHNILYSLIMENKDRYDLFIKLDADMVIEDPGFIGLLVDRFQNDISLDMFSYTVFDCFTQSKIWGVNSFSSRCFWKESSEGLFVDAAPDFPGVKDKAVDEKCMVSHCKSPGNYQAFMFGFHRGLKVIQSDSQYVLPGHSWVQIKTINKLQQSERIHCELFRRYALLGVLAAYDKKSSLCILKTDYEDLYEQTLQESPIDREVKHISIYTHIKAIGINRLFKSIFIYVIAKAREYV